MRHTITALQTTLKEVMQESREHVVCVARPIVIGLWGSIMTQHLVKGAAMTSSQQQECCSLPHPQSQSTGRAVMSLVVWIFKSVTQT